MLKAEALLDQGKTPEALTLIKDPAPRELGQIEVRRLIDLAVANERQPGIALAYLQKAQSEVTDEDLRIQIAHLQGIVLYLEGQRAPGEAKVREALALATKAGKDYYAARALTSLCYFKEASSLYSEAVDFCESALVLDAKTGAEYLKARTLLNLGYLYAYFGDETRPVKFEEDAIKIFQKVQDQSSRRSALGELGVVLGMQRQPKRAVEAYKEAYRLAGQDDDTYDARRFASNLALAYVDLEQWDDAELWNRKGNPTSPFVMRNNASIALGRGQTQEFFRAAREALGHAETPTIRWQLHFDMARAYAGISDFRNAFLEYEKALSISEEARLQARDDEMKKIKFLPRLMDLFHSYVDALMQDHQEAKALKVIEKSRARVLADRFGAKEWEAMRVPTANSNTVFLSFWIAPGRSYLWLISSQGRQVFVLPEEDTIGKAVADYKSAIEDEHKDPRAPDFRSAGARPLWDMLLKQAAARIPRNSRVVVIPDGPLHQLNLETLVVPGAPSRYWLEDVELVIAPSLAMAPSLAASVADRPVGQGLKVLLIGAPNYTGPTYAALPYAEKELKNIQVNFTAPPAKVIERQNATPAAYFASGPEQFAMIHFAAHADADPENPLDSAVILSHEAGGSYKLYARDIYKSKIPIHADLVTVSACRSAGAKAYAGEGLIGFAWVFLASGARNVIAGLWNVDDESASTLMSDLYAGIAKGESAATALRGAKLKLMKTNAEPYYWGPLQVYSASR